jgi:uncharacterized protein YjbI with pentapeptide repeats
MIEGEELKNIDFNKVSLDQEYDNCQFVNCNFSEVDVSNIKFIDCQFKACNFSQTKWYHTSIQVCEFTDCKMLGIDFSNVNEFLLKMSFHHCQLNLSSFYALKLKSTPFINCQLNEVDFVETDLSKVNFSGSNLKDATFDQTILSEADFRTAESFSIDPTKNRIRNAKFRKDNVLGLLDGLGILIE